MEGVGPLGEVSNLTVASAFARTPFNVTQAPAATVVYMCSNVEFTQCYSLSTINTGGAVSGVSVRSIWCGAATQLRVLAGGVSFDYSPIGGYTNSGKYPDLDEHTWDMPSANTTEDEVTEISVFVAPFSQESVMFEKVAPGCAQSSRTGGSSLFKIGNYNELSPWTGSFRPNPEPLSLINATSPQFGAVVSNVTLNDDMPGETFENVNNNTIPVAGLTNGSEPVYNGNASINTQNGLSTTANRIVVGADVSVTLFALQNFAGESITIVGPTIQCLDIPEPDGALTTAFQSFTVGRTWRAITGSWRQVFHPSNSAITASLTVGFRWGRATTVQGKLLAAFGATLAKGLVFADIGADNETPNEETVTPADEILTGDEIDDLIDVENGINEEQLALESVQTQNGGSGSVSKSLLVTLSANKARELVNSLLTSKNSDKVYVNSGNCIDPLSYTQKVKDNTTYDFVAMYQWHLEGTLHQKELEPVVFSSANFLCIYHASSRVPWPRCSLLQCADKFCQRCL